MADLNVVIGADISNYKAGMAQVGSIASSTSNEVTKELAQAANATTNLGGSAQSASMRFMQMRSGISAARDGVMAFTLGGQAAERSLMAMGHHINSLVNETGSFSGAMKALASSLLGPGGIILGLTVAAELFSKFGKAEDDTYDATKHFSDAADATHAIVQKLDTSYSEAVKNVSELTENVKLAKQGFIDKNEVVKEYNDTLGKTMGSVKTLDEVEQKLVSGGSAYVKMMLYKAAAQTALKEASEKALEAAKVQLEDQSKFESLGAKATAFSIGGTTAPGIVPGADPMQTAKQKAEVLKQFAEKARAEQIASFQKDEDKLIQIADGFQTKAAQISAQNKWDFFPDQKKAKVKEAVTGLDLLKQKLAEAQTALQDSIVAGGTNANDFNSPLLKQIQTLQAAIDKAMGTYNILMGLAPRNELLSAKGLGSERGFGQGLDNGGLLENSGVRQFSADQLGNAGLGKTNDEVVASMQRGVKAFQDQTEWAYQAKLAMEHYNEEMKAVNNITTLFGGGLTRAFESALHGTQSFVSAMGQFLLQLIEKLIAAAAAAAVLDVLLSATGFGGAVSFGSLFGQLSGFKNLFGGTSSGSSSYSPNEYAGGGIFSQPTLGIFGERGPEAIVTPDHLADFAGVQQRNNSGGWNDGQIVGVLRGSDIQLQYLRSAKTKSRTQ